MPPYLPWGVYASLYASLTTPPWVHPVPDTPLVTVLHSSAATCGAGRRCPGL